MNTPSDTPETDAAHHAVIYGTSRFSFPEHARKMERERDAARAEVRKLREIIANRESSTWILVADKMPDIDQVVWLYDAVNKVGPWKGVRSDVGGGWLWCRCWISEWYDPHMRRWDCDPEESDDTPTHWQPLPNPPTQ